MLGIVIFLLAMLTAAVIAHRRTGRAAAVAPRPLPMAKPADPGPPAPIPSDIAPAGTALAAPSVRSGMVVQDPLIAMMCGPGLCTPVDR